MVTSFEVTGLVPREDWGENIDQLARPVIKWTFSVRACAWSVWQHQQPGGLPINEG